MSKPIPSLAPTTIVADWPDCKRAKERIPRHERLDNHRYGTRVERPGFSGQCVRKIGTPKWYLHPYEGSD